VGTKLNKLIIYFFLILIFPALAVAAAIYGLEKLMDPEGKNQSGLEDSIDKFLGIKYNNQ